MDVAPIGWLVFPKNSFVDILTPNTSECNLIWKQGLSEVIQLKWISYGRVQIQYNWCPYKKDGGNGVKETDKHTEKTMWRDGEVLCEDKGCSDTSTSPREHLILLEARREAWSRPLPRAFRGNSALLTSCFQTSSLHNHETTNVCSF